MSRIHSDRLNTKRAHKDFAGGLKKALQKADQGSSAPLGVSPRILDAEELSLTVPPGLDRAFGYRGNLRFVQFGYSANTGQFEYCDGGDDILSAGESVWRWFLRHPVISPHLPESKYPTLYGAFSPGETRPALEEIMTKGTPLPSHDAPAHHYFLLDRQDLKAYVARRDQTLIFFALVHPDGEDPHRVFVDDLLMSAGTEDYKRAPSPDCVEQVRRFLDAQVEASRVV